MKTASVHFAIPLALLSLCVGVNTGSGTARAAELNEQQSGGAPTPRTVPRAFLWLSRHQNPSDGSWSLQDYTKQCKGKTCTGTGTLKSDSAATGLALLPFLGAGLTHKFKGPYQRTVAQGLNWLIKHQKPDGDLSAGAAEKMLAHGIAATTLCESYGLTGDPTVGRAAQAAIKFIIAAQDKNTGGWAAKADASPCTSVSVWQIMALKSAQMAGLAVTGQAETLQKAAKFLDSLQSDGGAKYGETSPKDVSDTATAMALLARAHLGWQKDHPAIKRGIEHLAKTGPSKKDALYNFYATMFMHIYPGVEWDDWSRAKRKMLVDSQVKADESCANGSWFNADDPRAAKGGRLFQTSMNTLTLEVYYRYLPLFKTDAESK
jgi:hypothetical protein